MRDAGFDLGDGRFQQLRRARQTRFLRLHIIERAATGRRFNPADSRCDAAFAQNLEKADVACTRDVRSTTQFVRRADVEHAHFVAIFFAEQHHRAFFARVVDRHDALLRGLVFQNLGVHDRFDTADLFVGHRRVVREVEPRALCINERSLLLNVRSQHLAKRLVHQMRRRVVAHRAAARVRVHLGRDGVADVHLARLDFADMAGDIGLNFLRVVDGKQRQANAALRQLAAIADLPARFSIERRLVEDHDAALARHERFDGGAALVQRDDASFIG